jgi:hypothetical protein
MAAPRSRRSRDKRGFPQWTLKEMELLKRHHSELTFKELQAQHLPHRTIGGIKRMAYLLGLKKRDYEREYGQPRWTKSELQVVSRYFPALSASEIQRRFLPHRSIQAILGAAKKFGLRAFPSVPWSDEELEILRQEFLVGGAKRVHQRLPHRTMAAIHFRSREEGLVYVPRGDGEYGEPWSEDELQRLKAHRHLPAEELAKLFPNRQKSAVINKRYKLGWSPANFWSEAESKRLQQHLDAPRDELCRLFPDRTWTGVRKKRDKLRRKQASTQKPNKRKA